MHLEKISYISASYIPYTKIHSSGSKYKKLNFRNVGKDVESELVFPVGGDGGDIHWFEYIREQFRNIKNL